MQKNTFDYMQYVLKYTK